MQGGIPLSNPRGYVKIIFFAKSYSPRSTPAVYKSTYFGQTRTGQISSVGVFVESPSTEGGFPKINYFPVPHRGGFFGSSFLILVLFFGAQSPPQANI